MTGLFYRTMKIVARHDDRRPARQYCLVQHGSPVVTEVPYASLAGTPAVIPGPLRYRFGVGCPVERAFELWTTSAGVWWPMAMHSVSGRRDAVLVIEPGVDGRIYEQTAGGQQFSWGMVMAWEPPRRLVCEWLVGDTPTELEVRFAPDAGGGTMVEIEHRGWERFSIVPVAGGISRGCAELAAPG